MLIALDVLLSLQQNLEIENARVVVFTISYTLPHLHNISYAHPTYVIYCVIISFIIEAARGGLRVLLPSIVARFIARDPVSFECWFAWLHQSSVIILSSYVSLHTKVTSIVHDIEISDQTLKLQILYKSDERSRQLHITRLTLLLFIICYKEVGCKIIKCDTFNAHDCPNGKQH